MKLKIKILILICIFGFVQISSAEYYKFTDKNGNIHYTDDFYKVPAAQRKDVEAYEETTAPATKKKAEEKDVKADKASPEEEYSQFQEKRNRLVEEQKSIEAEFNALTEERNELQKQMKPRMLRPQAVELEKKFDALNQKVAEFEKRRKAFDEKARLFNEEAENSKKKEGLKDSKKSN